MKEDCLQKIKAVLPFEERKLPLQRIGNTPRAKDFQLNIMLRQIRKKRETKKKGKRKKEKGAVLVFLQDRCLVHGYSRLFGSA